MRKSWLDRVKKFLGIEPRAKNDKRERKKKWIIGKLKSRTTPALLSLPKPDSNPNLLRQVEDEHKHAVAVAIATAAAAEAAVAAAQAAAEVVRLTGTLSSYRQMDEHAALYIQRIFRGYLARKALWALKGFVMLQALIRGQNVRQQTAVTLRSLQSILMIQSHTRARAKDRWQSTDFLQRGIGELGDKFMRFPDPVTYAEQTRADRASWDCSIFSKDEMDAMLRNKEEAALKRMRTLQYASSQNERMGTRRSLISRDDLDNLNRRWKWLEQWVNSQPFNKDISEIHQTSAGTERRIHLFDPFNHLHEQEDELKSLARRSFIKSRQNSSKDDGCFSSSSPSFPSYMESTASTKAKYRSLSTPKERMGATDVHSEYGYPSPKLRGDHVSSKVGRPPLFYKSSPRMKTPIPVLKSRRSPSQCSFDSESLSQHFDHCLELR